MTRNKKHQPASQKQLIAIFSFTFLYIAIAIATSLMRGNREFVFYIAVMAVIIFGLDFLHRRVGLSSSMLWALSIWGLTHMAGGLAPIPAAWHSPDVPGVLYNLWFIRDVLKYDQVVHAYGFGITTWLCWQALISRISGPKNEPRATPGLMILCAAAGMGFGAFNEIIEFIATLTLPETNVGGYANTGWDLVSNFIGACGAALLIYFFSPREEAPPTR